METTKENARNNKVAIKIDGGIKDGDGNGCATGGIGKGVINVVMFI